MNKTPSKKPRKLFEESSPPQLSKPQSPRSLSPSVALSPASSPVRRRPISLFTEESPVRPRIPPVSRPMSRFFQSPHQETKETKETKETTSSSVSAEPKQVFGTIVNHPKIVARNICHINNLFSGLEDKDKQIKVFSDGMTKGGKGEVGVTLGLTSLSLAVKIVDFNEASKREIDWYRFFTQYRRENGFPHFPIIYHVEDCVDGCTYDMALSLIHI
jgi:hypothetical protein